MPPDRDAPAQGSATTPQGWQALLPPGLAVQVEDRIRQSAQPPLIRQIRLMGSLVACCVVLREEAEGELLLLTVAQPLRRRGLAARLLAEMREDAIAAGLTRLRASWAGTMEDGGAIGRLLERGGWTPPARQGIAMTMTAAQGQGFLAPLAAKMPACPAEFVPWTSLSARQREDLRAALRHMPLDAPGLDPFAVEATASPDLSLAMLLPDGRIGGWHLSRWSDSGAAWVIASYGLPELLGGPCFLRAWIHFFQVAGQRGPETVCGWDTDFSLNRMSRFLLRRAEAARPVMTGKWSSSLALPQAVG